MRKLRKAALALSFSPAHKISASIYPTKRASSKMFTKYRHSTLPLEPPSSTFLFSTHNLASRQSSLWLLPTPLKSTPLSLHRPIVSTPVHQSTPENAPCLKYPTAAMENQKALLRQRDRVPPQSLASAPPPVQFPTIHLRRSKCLGSLVRRIQVMSLTMCMMSLILGTSRRRRLRDMRRWWAPAKDYETLLRPNHRRFQRQGL